MTVSAAQIIGGNSQTGRVQDDFYPTPPGVTEALLKAWRPAGRIVWEPACGDGAMAKVLSRLGWTVLASDLYDRGYGAIGVDFLQTTNAPAQCLITNPPYNIADQFIRHAFDLDIPQIALLLKCTYWHAAKRNKFWVERPPAYVMPLLWRPDFKGLGQPTMDFQWTIFDDTHEGPCEYWPLEKPCYVPTKRI